jgi:hypothetical protein
LLNILKNVKNGLNKEEPSKEELKFLKMLREIETETKIKPHPGKGKTVKMQGTSVSHQQVKIFLKSHQLR